MKYLCIENKGEVSPEGLLLMGASTKRDQSDAIGLFGTGNKYAIAVLMREKIPLIIVSGNVRYTFGTEMVSFRDHDFERITLRTGRHKAEATQFTTSMGPGWELSGAVRELISNAYDEQNAEVFISGEILDRPGFTRVYVQLTEAVSQIYKEFDRYFTFRRPPLVNGDGWAVYPAWGPGTRMYRRGVLVYEDSDLLSCFDYQNDGLDVREDRTSERYDCERAAAWIMKKLDIVQLGRVTEFLSQAEGQTFEGNLNYLDWYSDEMAEHFQQLLNGRILVNRTQFEQFSAELANHSIFILPDKWVDAFRHKPGIKSIRDVVSAQRLKGYTVIDLADLNTREFHTLEQALSFAGLAGIEIDPRKVSVFESDNEGAPDGNALIDSGEILIHRRVLSNTVQYAVQVLFEEFIHIDSSNSDYTRGFQNSMLKHWVKSLERFIPLMQQEAAA